MKYLTILWMLFSVATTSMAQMGPPPEDDMGRPNRHRDYMPPGMMPGNVDHAAREEHIIERFKTQANITADQETKIRSILKNTTSQIVAVEDEMKPQMEQLKAEFEQLKNASLSRQEKMEKARALKDQYAPLMQPYREQLRAIRQSSRQQINQILTTEQKATLYEKMGEGEPRKERHSMKVKQKYKRDQRQR